MTKPVNQVTMPSTGGGAGQRLCIKPHPPEPGPGPEAAEDKSLLTGVPASFLPPTLCAQYRGQSDLLNTPVRLCNSWPVTRLKARGCSVAMSLHITAPPSPLRPLSTCSHVHSELFPKHTRPLLVQELCSGAQGFPQVSPGLPSLFLHIFALFSPSQ